MRWCFSFPHFHLSPISYLATWHTDAWQAKNEAWKFHIGLQQSVQQPRAQLWRQDWQNWQDWQDWQDWQGWNAAVFWPDPCSSGSVCWVNWIHGRNSSLINGMEMAASTADSLLDRMDPEKNLQRPNCTNGKYFCSMLWWNCKRWGISCIFVYFSAPLLLLHGKGWLCTCEATKTHFYLFSKFQFFSLFPPVEILGILIIHLYKISPQLLDPSVSECRFRIWIHRLWTQSLNHK